MHRNRHQSARNSLGKENVIVCTCLRLYESAAGANTQHIDAISENRNQ